jgi:hypothetical protein
MSKPLFNACFVDGVKHTLDRIVYSSREVLCVVVLGPI